MIMNDGRSSSPEINIDKAVSSMGNGDWQVREFKILKLLSMLAIKRRFYDSNE
jgi:hypothetical protein